MKRLLLSLVLFAGIVASAWAAPTAKAIYCAGNTTLYFTYDEATYTVGNSYENLDNQVVTKVYNNIRSTGYGNSGSSKVPWTEYRTVCTKAKFLENIKNWKPTSLSYFFYDMEALATLEGADNLDVSYVTSLKTTFYHCALSNVNFLSSWIVSNVTDFSGTFSRCNNLSDISGLSNWDTSKGTTFNSTFMECAIDNVNALANWDFRSVETIASKYGNGFSQLFANCDNLSDISALEYWDVSRVPNFGSTFYNCKSLTDISPIAEWNTGNVQNMGRMFDRCTSLTDFSPISNWNVEKCTEFAYTFQMTGITDLSQLSGWDIGSAIYLTSMFRGCLGITNLDALSSWKEKTGNVTYLAAMFHDCVNLTDINGIKDWNTANVNCMAAMFQNCTRLTGKIDFSNWDLSNIDYSYISTGNANLTGFESDFNKYGIDFMFFNCPNIIGVSLGKNNLGKTSRTYRNVFFNCPKLRYVDFSGCTDELGNLTSATRATANTMFYTVPLTTVIYLPSGNTKPESGDVTNIVYTDGSDLKCDEYYSEDKVDIEFPHEFKTPKAIYTRDMSAEHGTVILPYEFKTNDNSLAYTLNKELTNQMFFVETPTVPAHTPFAFKKRKDLEDASTLGASDEKTLSVTVVNEEENWWDGTATATYKDKTKELGNTNLSMVSEDGGYSITVSATNTTSASEKTVSGDTGTPYVDGSAAITDEAANKWTTKGYYINETVTDYSGTFYIAGDKFYKADGALTMYPHRVTFHGAWTKGDLAGSISGAKSINFAMADVVTAIEAAEAREAEKNEIFDIQGRQQTKLNRGMNIVRMSDGSVRKIMVK